MAGDYDPTAAIIVMT